MNLSNYKFLGCKSNILFVYVGEKTLYLQKISMMATCYILFGSNMFLQRDSGTSDKQGIFDLACSYINKRCGRVMKVSSSYESEPWGFRQLLEIEHELGRERHPEAKGYVSRTADLDILYYGERIILTEILTVPHPRLHRRRFALLPMCEVAPDLVHPALGLTQTELLARCPDTLMVRKIEND